MCLAPSGKAACRIMVGFNKKAFKPQLDAIKDKYYEMFRNKSGKETRV
jgi:hypothetical protein